jgi:hypothetical protein
MRILPYKYFWNISLLSQAAAESLADDKKIFIICKYRLIKFVRSLNTTLMPHKTTEWYTYELRTRASLRLPRHQDAFVRTSNDSSWTVLIAHSAVSIMKWISWKKGHNYAKALLYCVRTYTQYSSCAPLQTACETHTHMLWHCVLISLQILRFTWILYMFTFMDVIYSNLSLISG